MTNILNFQRKALHFGRPVIHYRPDIHEKTGCMLTPLWEMRLWPRVQFLLATSPSFISDQTKQDRNSLILLRLHQNGSSDNHLGSHCCLEEARPVTIYFIYYWRVSCVGYSSGWAGSRDDVFACTAAGKWFPVAFSRQHEWLLVNTLRVALCPVFKSFVWSKMVVSLVCLV